MKTTKQAVRQMKRTIDSMERTRETMREAGVTSAEYDVDESLAESIRRMHDVMARFVAVSS